MSWSPEAHEALMDDLGEEVALRVEAAVEGAIEAAEQDAIRFLLDGLNVPSIQELHRLVQIGRAFDLIEAVGGLLEVLAEGKGNGN